MSFRILSISMISTFPVTEIEGADDSGITGTTNGVTFHYYAVASYRTLLAAHGMGLVDVHDEPGVSTYYLARKWPFDAANPPGTKLRSSHSARIVVALDGPTDHSRQ